MVDEEAGVGTVAVGGDAQRVAELEREVRELRQAKEVLETIRAYFLGQPESGVAVPVHVPAAGRARGRPREAHSVSSAVVEIRTLGPLEAVVAGRSADLGTPKQRALLALLASRVGQPATAEVIVEELWDGSPPPSAMTSLQAYVANLRRVLEPGPPRTPATRLRTCGGGYVLDARAVQVDACRFSEHATAGWQAWRSHDPQLALREFEQGLALWRGSAYVEVAGVMSVLPAAARLEELRLSVTEGRCAALLELGAHEVAIAELEAFTHAHPLREYGCELLSLALYRAGRQADALATLRANRKRLADELGIEPRPSLRQLETRILNHAPLLG